MARGLQCLAGTRARTGPVGRVGTRARVLTHAPPVSTHLRSLLPQVSGSAPGRGARVLHVEVTDETDAFFLHSLTVGEAEYGELRADRACRPERLVARACVCVKFTRALPRLPPPLSPLS